MTIVSVGQWIVVGWWIKDGRGEKKGKGGGWVTPPAAVRGRESESGSNVQRYQEKQTSEQLTVMMWDINRISLSLYSVTIPLCFHERQKINS